MLTREGIEFILRAILKVGGGMLIAKGIADESAAEAITAGILAVFGVLWGHFARKALKDSAAAGLKLTELPLLIFGLFAAALLLPGCARFTTTQTDLSYNENGQPLRKITTRATAGTVFEAKSALASFKAQQTDKTQSAAVGGLNQESSGASSNAISAAGQFLGELIKAAAPVPK